MTSRRRSHAAGPVPLLVGLPAFLFVTLLLALSIVPAPAAASGSPGSATDGTNLTAYRATDTSFGSAGAVEEAIANGSLEPADMLVVGDTLVVAIDSPRLAEAMDAGGGTTTERFRNALDGGAELRLVQTNPTPQKNRKVAAVGPENVTAYRNGTTTYALVDTGDLPFRYRTTNRSARIYGGERFALKFGYTLVELSSGGYEPAGPVVGFEPFEADFDTNGRWYEPLPPEWVRLAVDVGVRPDEGLVARTRLDSGRTITASVDPDDVPGLNGVWLDLRGIDPGTGYTLELVHDGEVVDRYEGTVREPRATLSGVTITESGGATAINATVSASHGGQIRVLDESCDVLAAEWIEPGLERRVTLELWSDGHRMQVRPDVLVRVARHRGSSDALYRGTTWTTAEYDGGYCPPEDQPSPPAPTPTATSPSIPTATPPATATPTMTPFEARSLTASRTGGTTGSDGPGFTVATAFVGLLTLAFWRRRRS